MNALCLYDFDVFDHIKSPNYVRQICAFYSHALRGLLYMVIKLVAHVGGFFSPENPMSLPTSTLYMQ